MQKKIDLLDYLHTLFRWRKFVAVNVFLVALVALIVSLLLPKQYLATTTILPPKNKGLLSGFSDVSSLLRGLPGISLAGGAVSAELYQYITILKSRTALEQVVRRFDLIKVYEINKGSMGKAVKELLSHLVFKIEEEGTLSIGVTDRNPQRAADMANYLVELLNGINIELNTREVRSNREFIERRIEKNRADLTAAEEALKTFQEKHGIIMMPQEQQTSISAIGQLYAQKTRKEIELSLLERSLGTDNPILQSTRNELSVLNTKLKDMPDLGTEYIRLYREYVIQNKIYEVIVPLWEQAKFEEKRDTPTLLVLDKAELPERHIWPRKSIIVLIFAMLAFIISVAIAFVAEHLSMLKQENPTEYQRLQNFWLELRHFLPGKRSTG
ncbi:MAG: Wzz/FepE/Etk N-terminal domain-containing protein [candidate division KSB1 bacterium]|nr:Wzz/FepE/Etk N-terminal domain-containing protein [candidate division KSB1 bacterium]MDZ7301015.1 Wzz/FepE/Etk N-terminal domain-containing protein [candidate division KSB1 bacterium]MDZ7310307.1 Wzz/FepE/Etk N-terminal domain-containing protein [candidate division KSB1 bacterium]